MEKNNLDKSTDFEKIYFLNKQRYRNVVEITSDFIWEVNNNTEYTYASPNIYNILGYRPEEILGKTPYDLMPPEEAVIVKKRFSEIAAQKKSFISLENVNLHKDGRKIVLETSGVPYYSDGELRGYHGVDRDITGRKKMEEALAKAKDELELKIQERTKELKESEEKYRNVVDNANEMIVVSQQDIIRFVNTKGQEITGYSAEELVSRPFADFVHPSDRAVMTERYQKRASGEAVPSNYEFRIIHKDGSTKWVAISAVLIQWEDKPATLGLVSNITERKQAEERIKESENQLRSIFDALTEGIALIAPDGTIIRANKAEARILGFKSPDERIGKQFLYPRQKHLLPDGTPLSPEDTCVMMAIERKQEVQRFENSLIKEDGSTLWINTNAVPIIDESGQVKAVVRSMTDITEQKRLKEESEQFTKKLLTAQEDERKRISRELHDETAQYLALLNLELDALIEKENAASPEAAARLRKLKETAEKALQEVRRFSHELRPSVLEHFGLASALELIIGEFMTVCPVEVNLSISGSERRLKEETELALFRIAQESLSNIRKHSAATQAKITLKYFNTGKIRLAIADNGKGFSLNKKKKTDGKGGLGLIGMRERAHLIGANLRVKSRPGLGTVVSVELTG